MQACSASAVWGDDRRIGYRLMARTLRWGEPGGHWPWATVGSTARKREGEAAMRAARLHAFDAALELDEVPAPEITGPFDVIVRVGGAGFCRTDLHIMQGWFNGIIPVDLPVVLGHENAGWVQAVGPQVANLAVGDAVVLHPRMSCGMCRACRMGRDMHCTEFVFSGATSPGGFAEFLKTSARAVVELPPGVQPSDVAAHADAGVSACHAAKKAAAALYPDARAVAIGAGGVGHIGIQCLRALSPAELIVVDRSPQALELARECGADHTVVADGGHAEAVRELTDGSGAQVVLDFVGEGTVGDGVGPISLAKPAGTCEGVPMPEDYFGEDVAAGYDEDAAEMFEREAVDPVVDFLAGLAGGGAALELGVGTGRIALPLAQRGIHVHGIDLSEAMVARLRAKPGAERVGVTIGDFATTTVDSRFKVAYLVFNTIGNLTTQDGQVACFQNVAAHLEPGGCFVVEVGVPELQRLPPGETVRAFEVGATRLGFDEYDVANQGLVSHHYAVVDGKLEVVSMPFRYVWPSELDLMARLAGMTLRERWSGWKREPFTSDSRKHVSVWEKPASPARG
jgi:D-arabinose 1-dehydrogenase-like Zn-dependent alcohol dehydrogenase